MDVLIIDKVSLTSGVDHSMSVEVAMGEGSKGKGRMSCVASMYMLREYSKRNEVGEGLVCSYLLNTGMHTHMHIHWLT